MTELKIHGKAAHLRREEAKTKLSMIMDEGSTARKELKDDDAWKDAHPEWTEGCEEMRIWFYGWWKTHFKLQGMENRTKAEALLLGKYGNASKLVIMQHREEKHA